MEKRLRDWLEGLERKREREKERKRERERERERERGGSGYNLKKGFVEVEGGGGDMWGEGGEVEVKEDKRKESEGWSGKLINNSKEQRTNFSIHVGKR